MPSEKITLHLYDGVCTTLEAEGLREARGNLEAAPSLNQLVNRAVTDFVLDDLPRVKIPPAERDGAAKRKVSVRLNAQHKELLEKLGGEKGGPSVNHLVNFAMTRLVNRMVTRGAAAEAGPAKAKKPAKAAVLPLPGPPLILIGGGDTTWPLVEAELVPATVYAHPDTPVYRQDRAQPHFVEHQALVARLKAPAKAIG